MNRALLVCTGSLMLVALAAPAQASNLLVNGSFEIWSGGIQDASTQPDRIFNDGSLSVSGWNFAIGLSSDLYRDKNATSAVSNRYDAAHLDYMAGCGSFFTLHEGVSQTFNVIANTWHKVTFKMAPGGMWYSGSWIENASVSSAWQVDVTGAVASSVTQTFNTNLANFSTSATTNPLVWSTGTLYFQSNSVGGNVTLQFTAYGDLTHVYLDDVVVEEYPAQFNDECSTATIITGPGPHPFDNAVCSTGTVGQNESVCLFGGQTAIDSDQWYVWTAGANGYALLMTCGGIASTSPSDDTKVAIYSGNACPTAPALACNDDVQCGSSSLTSIVQWNIACGQKYLIQLGRAPGALASMGTFTINEFGTACTGTIFCPGDGTGTACACANFGASLHGCGNSLNASGASLTGAGSARVSSDSFTLSASGMPNSSALYFQGTSQQNGGLGAVFGDGLRCAGGSVLRLSVQINANGASQYPFGPGDAPISVRGAIPPAGGVRDYQCWYRNAAAFCTPSTFNLTNGLEVLWLP